MIKLRNILSIAKYERKTLFRSWFFKIFSILTLFILFGINMGFFVESNVHWTTKAIPANLPFINVLFVNVAQAIIAVFLASDFIRRDKKLDTTEVIYARPISNGEYVVGKTLGIMTLFMGLVLVVVSMGLVINLIIKDTPVEWMAYLFYPLLISVPTLVFILGLSFFLMILLRNQAVTFVVLLGYIGLTLFYFKDKLHGLLDYMAFNLPMVYSDIIQFSDLNTILIQRSAYLLLGIGFIFATIRFLGRLAQIGRWNFVNLFSFILFLCAGLLLGYKYYSGYNSIEQDRIEFLHLNNTYAKEPIPDVVSNDLQVSQHGKRLKISSGLLIRNQYDHQLDTLIFSLNPGFKLDSIFGRDGPVIFEREKQIVKILPAGGLEAYRRAKFTFYYSGIAVESVAYLDVPKKFLASLKRIQVATLDKRPGIIDENFILLTSELLWYPIAGVGFNNKTFQASPLDFVRFTLSVKPSAGMTAIAPGDMEEEDGIQKFTEDKDLNTFPLVIGKFEKKSIEVEGVDYSLFLKPGHDYFSEFFPTIADTLGALINEFKSDYEYDELDLYLQFNRIKLIEVPVQYHPYERPFTQMVEMIQPEIIFMPEKGAGLSTLDFKRLKNAEDQRNKERNSAKTGSEIESDMFENFLENTLFRSDISTRSGFRGRGERIVDFDGESIYTKNPYCIFPLYYNLVTGISSDDYPALNAMIETYLKDGYEVSIRQSFTGGITENEKANLALRENSLSDIFLKKNSTLVNATIYQAGSFIITALKNKVGITEFDNFLYYYLEDHAFSEILFETFSEDFKTEFGVDIMPYLEFIKSGSKMPEFIVSTPEYYQTRDNYGDVYIIRIDISNIGGSSGLVDLNFRMPGQGGFGGGSMNTEHRIYEIEAGISKEMQLVFYDQPRMMTINTLVSGNIPSSFSVFLRSATNKTITNLEEYEHIIDSNTGNADNNEIIVDNEDPGFSYVSVSNESKLKKYIDSRKVNKDQINYKTLGQAYTPSTWISVAHSGMYGQIIRSAMVVRKGDGGNVARWSTVIPEAGFYDIYVYIPVSAMYRGPDRSRGRGRGDQNGDDRRRGPEFADRGTEYKYIVESNEGKDEVTLRLDEPEDGWNRLGSFHFPADTATISLSNNTNGNRVIADAVKWVPKD